MTNDICQRCRQRIKAGVCLCAFLTGFGAALVTGDEPPPSSAGGAIMSSFVGATGPAGPSPSSTVPDQINERDYSTTPVGPIGAVSSGRAPTGPTGATGPAV